MSCGGCHVNGCYWVVFSMRYALLANREVFLTLLAKYLHPPPHPPCHSSFVVYQRLKSVSNFREIPRFFFFLEKRYRINPEFRESRLSELYADMRQ